MAAGPEEIRLRYLYRRLVLWGRGRIPLEAARRLVGPDCAYHLYALPAAGEDLGAQGPDLGANEAPAGRIP